MRRLFAHVRGHTLKRLTQPLAVALLLGALPTSAAELPSDSGFEGAFRASVALPFGNLAAYSYEPNSSLSAYVGVEFPLALDLGYRIGRYVFLGVTGQYAFGTPGVGLCATGETCTASGVQVGAEVQLHPLGRATPDPWLGLGFGYEWLIVQSKAIPTGVTSGAIPPPPINSPSGFDLLVFTAGIDFTLGCTRLGPFVGFTLGQYSQASGHDIPYKALHFWLSAGLKFTVVP